MDKPSSKNVETSSMIQIRDLRSADIEEVEGIVELANEAKSFLRAQKWCRKIIRGYFDRGWAGILGIFYFTLDPGDSNADPYVWVIVGDIPPAYINVDDCPNGAAALDGYVGAMHVWVDSVREGKTIDDLIPVLRRGSLVKVTPSVEFADMLATRLDLIDREILSHYEDELREAG